MDMILVFSKILGTHKCTNSNRNTHIIHMFGSICLSEIESVYYFPNSHKCVNESCSSSFILRVCVQHKKTKAIHHVRHLFFTISLSDRFVLENRYEVEAKNRMTSQQQGQYIIVNNSHE